MGCSWIRFAAVILPVALAFGCGGKKGPPAGGTPAVDVVKVIQRTVPEIVEYVGQTEAPTNVEIRARVEGFIQQVAFQQGSDVKEGDLLFVIDPKPYEEKLANTQANMAEAQANQLKTQQDVDRFAPLAKAQAIAKRDYDNAIALNEQAKASVKAAQAQVAGAQLDLGYTQVRSPVNGRIGASQVRVGSLVGKGDPTLLAT